MTVKIMNTNQSTPKKRTVPIKLKMLQANIANRRPQIADDESRNRIFKLLIKNYLEKTKDTFIPSNQNEKDQKAEIDHKKKDFFNILTSFSRILKKKINLKKD
ncbi:hypothetical protein BVY03_03155 [bacterium K02(2017)]|nr:hypothetical protein BVY03_03155 [bacterium K02(2017)]